MKDPIAVYFVEKIQITLASKETLSLIINSENEDFTTSTNINDQVAYSKDDPLQIQIIEENEDQYENFDKVDDLMNCELKSRKVMYFFILEWNFYHYSQTM